MLLMAAVTMIALVWIAWRAERQGRYAWPWQAAALAVSGAALALPWLTALIAQARPGIVDQFAGTIGELVLWLVVTSAPLLIGAVFEVSWLLAGSEDVARAQQRRVVAEAAQAEREAPFQRLQGELIVLRIYEDAAQQYRLHADRARLEAMGIWSYVKTAGITTLSVRPDDAERAEAVLAGDPVAASEPDTSGGVEPQPDPANPDQPPRPAE